MEPWTQDVGEACVNVSVNGKTEKVNKGTISDLGEYISGKAAAAGIGKAAVYIDGEEVDPDDIGGYEVADIKEIVIKPFDIVR